MPDSLSTPRYLPLLYHELRPEPAAYSYVLSCQRFAEHLRLFTRLAPGSYTPVLTFDDGHLSNYQYALPMLQQAGVQAHFFITAGWTGTRPGYMSATHLRELHAAGHTIGAHGWSHALLTTCTDAELQHELVDARAALEDILGAPVTSVSLPGGRGNARVLHACMDAGYTSVWTSTPQPTSSLTAPRIGRFNILSSITDASLQRLLDPHTGALDRAARIFRAKTATQRILGDRLYAKLWSVLNRQEPDTAESTAP